MQLSFNATDLINHIPDHISLDVEIYPGLKKATPLINRIGLVGFCIDSKTDKFHESDGELLNYSLQALTTGGCEFSPNLSTDIINADKNHGGLNFFDVETPYDVLLFANLFMPSDIAKYKAETDNANRNGNHYFFLSPKHNKPTDPAEKSLKLSASIVLHAHVALLFRSLIFVEKAIIDF